MPNIGADMLTKAAETIKQRQSQYGPPEKNFKVIAARWNAHLDGRGYKLTDANGVPVMLDVSDVAHMSADIKMARLSENMDHEDSWKDLAGYAACGRQVTAAPGASRIEDLLRASREWRDDFVAEARVINQIPLWLSVESTIEVPDDLKTGDQIKVKYGSGDRVVTVGRQCVVPECLGQSYIDTDGVHWSAIEIIAYRRT